MQAQAVGISDKLYPKNVDHHFGLCRNYQNCYARCKHCPPPPLFCRQTSSQSTVTADVYTICCAGCRRNSSDIKMPAVCSQPMWAQYWQQSTQPTLSAAGKRQLQNAYGGKGQNVSSSEHVATSEEVAKMKMARKKALRRLRIEFGNAHLLPRHSLEGGGRQAGAGGARFVHEFSRQQNFLGACQTAIS